ncbi:hypothetical protein [Streptomyces colonosanans]|uniref:Calcium-binding protein n=1 Tax=Streptomyces colonosanans TaxID=1428652 RepID=A0A1S2PUN6_9ACTN|nr:hypothetical protein [Streptomyces colonosanans]OIJ96634.1 hypothetical protein BIV24_07825 [Streptomyces colonosanans]
MRIRATVAAVSGALALSAFAVPAAQADGHASFRADVAKVREAASAAHGKTAFGASAATPGVPYQLNVTFSNLKIGKAYKVGTTNRVMIPVSYTLTHGADVDTAASDFLSGPYIYKGSFDDPSNAIISDDPATCAATSATTATCKGNIGLYPARGELVNADAGSWKAGALAVQWNGQLDKDTPDMSKVGFADKGGLGSTLIQRYSRLTVDASPEPVKKGGTLTVTGKLTRANWETRKYAGYGLQSVQLQFCKKGSHTYTTLKTIKSGSTGNLKTTVKATGSGYYRYVFAGASTTPAVASTADYVAVK